MPEINLPTATKQDSIKQTVESIASNFPLEVGGGTDFNSKVLYFSSAPATQHEANSIINIQGKGILQAIRYTAGSGNSNVTLQIDGGNIMKFPLSGSIIDFNFIAGFNESLVINSSATTINVVYSLGV